MSYFGIEVHCACVPVNLSRDGRFVNASLSGWLSMTLKNPRANMLFIYIISQGFIACVPFVHLFVFDYVD